MNENSPTPFAADGKFHIETESGTRANVRFKGVEGDLDGFAVEATDSDGGRSGEVLGAPIAGGVVYVPVKGGGYRAERGVVRERKNLKPSSSANKTVDWEAYRTTYESIFGDKKPRGEG